MHLEVFYPVRRHVAEIEHKERVPLGDMRFKREVGWTILLSEVIQAVQQQAHSSVKGGVHGCDMPFISAKLDL